ncbi:MAG: nitroreductase family protein [Acidaminococcaceae bacterium]|nr:nitroreductase family protein [Acidaminococcaceae bacterium]MDD4722396.1 nitroreductase family protein [Acidaminococcaceae bacterium]
MALIEVNTEECIKCGICIAACPTRVLVMGEKGPEELSAQNCIACGHCVAICPKMAINNKKTPLVKQIEITEQAPLDKEIAKKFLRSRRSIRCYKDMPVPKDKLLELVEIARFAPTAGNGQDISYIIIKDKELLKRVTEVVTEWMEAEVLKGPKTHWSFPLHIRAYRENGLDNILRNAPHLLLAMAQKNLVRGRENSVFSLAYLELFAPSLGLGSCWAGIVEMCIFAGYAPLLELFNVPKDKVITGAVMVGYPKYKFKRLVDRNPLEVHWL